MLNPFSSVAGGIQFTSRAPLAAPSRTPKIIRPKQFPA